MKNKVWLVEFSLTAPEEKDWIDTSETISFTPKDYYDRNNGIWADFSDPEFYEAVESLGIELSELSEGYAEFLEEGDIAKFKAIVNSDNRFILCQNLKPIMPLTKLANRLNKAK